MLVYKRKKRQQRTCVQDILGLKGLVHAVQVAPIMMIINAIKLLHVGRSPSEVEVLNAAAAFLCPCAEIRSARQKKPDTTTTKQEELSNRAFQKGHFQRVYRESDE